MNLTLIAIIIAVIASLGGMVKAYYAGDRQGAQRVQTAVEAATKRALDIDARFKQETQNRIDDMAVAFKAGEDSAKTAFRKREAKGAADVTTFPVFQNPACTLPDAALQNLNAARDEAFGFSPGGLRDDPNKLSSPAVPAGGNQTPRIDAAVRPAAPGPTSPVGRINRQPVPTGTPGHRPLGSLQPAP